MGRNLAPVSGWEDRKDAATSRTRLVLVDDPSDGTVALTTGRSPDYEIQFDGTDSTWTLVEV